MAFRRRWILRTVSLAFVAGGLIAVGVLSAGLLGDRLPGLANRSDGDPVADTLPPILLDDEPGTLRLAADVPARMGIHTSEVQSAAQPVVLEFPGTLILNANRLSHIHARFAGEIVQLGGGGDGDPPIDVGAEIRKGQLLAVLWCRDLGEKKSELVDTLSQLRVDQETYDQMLKSSSQGAVPDRTLREQERRVETGRIARDRVVRTLQSWRVTKEEIETLYGEAERLAKGGSKTSPETVHEWAKLEIRAPLDGVLLERNVAQGDLVDTTLDLFKIADLSRLRVVAYAYEEELPSLDALRQDDRRWEVRVAGDPETETRPGRFDRIGRIIDPSQHTALVMGWVENPGGRLRVGQFVTAAVRLVPPKEEVAIPATAMVEDRDRQFVFVQPDPQDSRYTRRQVSVIRRSATTIGVRTEPTPEQRLRGAQPLRRGERVVSSGTVQLMGILSNLESSTAAAK